MTMKNYYEDKKSKFINEEELGSIFDLYDSYGFKTDIVVGIISLLLNILMGVQAEPSLFL